MLDGFFAQVDAYFPNPDYWDGFNCIGAEDLRTAAEHTLQRLVEVSQAS